jgi:hypothetical protein
MSQTYSKTVEYDISGGMHQRKDFMHIKILDVKELKFKGVNELSALAYRDGKLYALSDKGILYLFSISLQKGHIKQLRLQKRYLLSNTKSQRFKKKKRDAEGITFYKDGFLISFERKNRVLYCSREGRKIYKMKLHPLLEERKNYQSPNKGLESVVFSKKYGLITAPELSLKNTDKNYHTLYAKSMVWKFQAEGAITDMTLIDNNRVLILLREYSYLTQERVTSLVELWLDRCDEKRVCKSRLLAKLDSNDGWDIDNFEGVTKVAKEQYLMVSDDNDSFFQKTLLVLFEIKN